MTELSPIGCIDNATKPDWGSAGGLVPGTEGAVIGADGSSLPAGELGELLIRGPQVGRPRAVHSWADQRTYAVLSWPTSDVH